MKGKTIIYYTILIVVIGITIRGILLELFSFDIIGLTIILFQVFLIGLIFSRGSLTQVGIIGWAILFITKNIIPLVGVLLEHLHNDFESYEGAEIIKRLIKILISIVLIIIANKVSFVKEPEKDEQQSTKDVK